MAEGLPLSTLRVTDFDVTLFDTHKGLVALADIASRDLVGIEVHVSKKHMLDTYARFRQDNHTFQPEDYLRYHGMSSDNIMTVYKHYAGLNEPELLYEDGLRYIERVNSSADDHLMILTTGYERPQLSKLGAAGLLGGGVKTPVRIIRSHEKGKDIITWRNEKGLYMPPGVKLPECHTVVLVDDRRDAVQGMDPASSRVYVLEREGVSRRGAKVVLPIGAMVVASLDEIPVPLPLVV